MNGEPTGLEGESENAPEIVRSARGLRSLLNGERGGGAEDSKASIIPWEMGGEEREQRREDSGEGPWD